MGDFGYTFKSFGLKEFLKDWKIDANLIHSGEKKAFLNTLEDLKPEDSEWYFYHLIPHFFL